MGRKVSPGRQAGICPNSIMHVECREQTESAEWQFQCEWGWKTIHSHSMGTNRRVCRGAKRERNLVPEPERETFVLVWWGVGWGGVDRFPFGSILIGTATTMASAVMLTWAADG